MKVFIDDDVFDAIIENEFADVADFCNHWKKGTPTGSSLARGRSTIYDWSATGLSKQTEVSLSFFSALNVDPVAIVDIKKSRIIENFPILRIAFFTGGILHRNVTSLFRYFRPSFDWPDDEFLIKYWGHPWFVKEFHHTASTEGEYGYADITCTIPDKLAYRPSAFHIAYKNLSSLDNIWRPYGTVCFKSESCFLIHENGNYQKIFLKENSKTIQFQTFYGPTPISFRICSIDFFEIEVKFPSTSKDLLRFHGR